MYFHHPDVIHELVHDREQQTQERINRTAQPAKRRRRWYLPRIKFEYTAAQPEFVFRILFSNSLPDTYGT